MMAAPKPDLGSVHMCTPAAAPLSLQQQPGSPPQEPSVVETPPNAELQSQAPPTYQAVISGEKF